MNIYTFSGPGSTKPVHKLPGISDETLFNAGVRYTAGKLQFPYFDANGDPAGFARWLEPGPGLMKQPKGCSLRAYLPPQLSAMPPSDELVVVEGERNTLALIDSGIPCVGIPSLYCYARRGNEKALLEGLLGAIESRQPNTILTVGGVHTAFNEDFSRSALFLAWRAGELGIQVVTPRLPIAGCGRHVDECKERLRCEFKDWWDRLVKDAHPIDPDCSALEIADQLLAREEREILSSKGELRDALRKMLAKAAGRMRPGSSFKERLLRINRELNGRNGGGK